MNNKQLLLKDLCARLPYGLMVDRLGVPRKVLAINSNNMTLLLDRGEYMPAWYMIGEIKPYLRPMSSMTEAEKGEYHQLQSDIWKPCGTMYYDTADSIDWLNAHHFDYHYVSGRGYLIDTGLALEAPEGIYD